jgi:hypothetical protein
MSIDTGITIPKSIRKDRVHLNLWVLTLLDDQISLGCVDFWDYRCAGRIRHAMDWPELLGFGF